MHSCVLKRSERPFQFPFSWYCRGCRSCSVEAPLQGRCRPLFDDSSVETAPRTPGHPALLPPPTRLCHGLGHGSWVGHSPRSHVERVRRCADPRLPALRCSAASPFPVGFSSSSSSSSFSPPPLCPPCPPCRHRRLASSPPRPPLCYRPRRLLPRRRYRYHYRRRCRARIRRVAHGVEEGKADSLS